MSEERDQERFLIVLICIILFISIEVFRGNDLAALYHLDSGINLLKEIKGPRMGNGWLGRAAEGDDIEDELLPMFARLDLEVFLYLGLRPLSFNVCALRSCSFQFSSWTARTVFSSLVETSNSLISVLNLASKFQRSGADEYRYRKIGDIPLEVHAEQQLLLSRHFHWGNSFNAWMDSNFKISASSSSNHQGQTKQAHRINLLQIHHQVCTTVISCSLHAEETVYDSFSVMFAEIVTLARPLNASTSSSPYQRTNDAPQQQDQLRNETSFYLETGIIEPLYWTAIKCRDGKTRREAIRLLRTCSQEGVWVGAIQAAVADRVVEIEETGLLLDAKRSLVDEGFIRAKDVSESIRIHSVGVAIDRAKRIAEMECSRRLNGMDGEWDERVEWAFW